MNYRYSLLTVLEAGKCKIKVPSESVSHEIPLPSSQMASSCCPHMVEGVRGLSGVSFTRALIPFLRAPPSLPNHLPKAPHLHTHGG